MAYRSAPTATIERQGNASTLWCIKWPSSARHWGKTYYATTYPNSDLIYLETAAKRRHVSNLQGAKLMPQVRAAIEQAKQ